MGGLARLSYLVAALLIVLAATGCGGDDSSGAASADSEESGIPKSPPKVEVPPGLPPKKLVFDDLSEGTGTKAKEGDAVSLQYYCVAWENGAEYANSWRYPKAPTFVLGRERQLQYGLDLAVPGMKEGGGREVLVPSTLLYYPNMPHPPVSRLAALVCKVYLLNVLEKRST